MITEKQKKIISLISILAFIIFCGLVGWFIGRPMIRFVSDSAQFRAWVDSSGIMGRVWFVLMVAFQVVNALVPGEPLEIGAGYAFGAVEGTFLCVLGTAIGSLLVYLIVKKFGIKVLEVFFSIEKIKSAKFLQNPKKVGIIVFLMFFLPGTPKDLITYFISFSDINFYKFLILASFIRLPSIVTSTVGGGLLGAEKYTFAIVVFAVNLIISLIGWAIYNYISKKRC